MKQQTEFGDIPVDWQVKKIIDIKSDDKRAIAMGPFGSNIKTDNFVDAGVPVIRGTNMNYAKYVDGNFVYLTNEKADELIGSNCKPNDLVFTHRGTIGQVALIPHNKYPRYVISQSGMKLTVNQSIINSEFLFYFFKSDYGQYQILKYEAQVGVPSISNPLTSLKEMYVPVPLLVEQKAIASVLSSLDNKIDLLHRQNKTLEAMAETLFRQWFVETSNDYCKEVELHEIINFNPKRILLKGSNAIYLEMAGLNTNTISASGYYNRDFTSGQKFINQDTLLARITPCLENGKAGYIHFLYQDNVGWGSTEFIVLRPKSDFHPLFAYILCRNKDFKEYAESCMEGSSGRQRVNVSHLSMYTLNLPSNDVIIQFNKTLASIEPKLVSNALQIQTLQKLRDTLLPKLISGEVRVKYTPEHVEQ